MNVLIAIDSWKGCLTSREANEAVRRAVLEFLPNAQVQCIAVSDGGEGFLDAVADACPCQRITVDVLDPLMRPIKADYLMVNDTAVIEMAQASGLSLLSPEERNPLIASSYGTGQLIADALHRGAREVIVGLGGSATSDCGRGMLQSLEGMNWHGVHFIVATDVDNPLYGPQGAAHVFARQKGADDAMIAELDRRAKSFASTSERLLGRDLSQQPGAGAAGGVAYALMQYMGAERRSGAELLFDMVNFDASLSSSILVITGEGRADRQTMMGKLPSVVLRHARACHVPVWLVAGKVADAGFLEGAGFARVLPVTPPDMPLSEAIRPDVARRNIWNALRDLVNVTSVF